MGDKTKETRGERDERETVCDFEWDPAKALSNIHKHGVTFDQAATVFLDGLALTVYDAASSHGEERWFTLDCQMRAAAFTAVATRTRVGPGRARARKYCGASGRELAQTLRFQRGAAASGSPACDRTLRSKATTSARAPMATGMAAPR